MKAKKIVSLIMAAAILCAGGVSSAVAEDKVSSADFTKEEMELNYYDIYKYTLPYWEGNIVYNECVYPIGSAADEPKAYKLMYEATEIVSVRNYMLSVTYEEGRDYYLKDGMLYINPDGQINTIDYDYIHPTENSNNYDWTVYYPTRDGNGYEYWSQSTEISKATLVVTYIHNDIWKHPAPWSVEDDLPRTMEMLKNKEDITIVVNGDSVSAGAHSSGAMGLYPHADAYPEMTGKALAEKFGTNVNLVNTAVGGTTTRYTEEFLDSSVIQHNPDLVIINFGMNDSSMDRVGMSAEEFTSNLEGRINYIRERLPDCEFLLVSSLLGNIYTFPREKYEEHTAIYKATAEKYDGVAFCDPQSIMGSIIDSGKDYICFMADNMVHPNDFGMRLTTQCILAALDFSDIEEYKADQIANLVKYASPDDHVEDGKRDELLDIIERAENAIAEADNEWQVSEIIPSFISEIEVVLRRCAFEDHVFDHTDNPVTCNTDGYIHSVCTVCGYEYDHDFVENPGLEHIMDGGRRTIEPNYKSDGEFVSTCIVCGYEDVSAIPKLTDAPVDGDNHMLYIKSGLNYMQTQTVTPYVGGTAVFEMDICPLNIWGSGYSMPYAGLWISGYKICVAYNFRYQRVEIVAVDLPYGGTPTVYASAPYEWTPESGKYDCNWKRFSVKLSGNNVKVYIDGELILDSTKSVYSASTEVVLPYTAGEYYIDNLKIISGNYDPSRGRGGDTVWEWRLDTEENRASFFEEWHFGGYTVVSEVAANMANKSTAVPGGHYHEVMAHIKTVKPTCSLGGYSEYLCETCGETVFLNFKDPISATGHDIVETGYSIRPTETEDGVRLYRCNICGEEFTQIVPAGTDIGVVEGDANADGYVDSADLMTVTRYLAGLSGEINLIGADANTDGYVDSADLMTLKRRLAGLSA